jgi:hypothetical protein
MIDSFLSVEQENRERQARGAEASLNTDLYSEGFFDGLIGCSPRHVEEASYWEGYQIGLRENWAKKLGVVIPTEF